MREKVRKVAGLTASELSSDSSLSSAPTDDEIEPTLVTAGSGRTIRSTSQASKSAAGESSPATTRTKKLDTQTSARAPRKALPSARKKDEAKSDAAQTKQSQGRKKLD